MSDEQSDLPLDHPGELERVLDNKERAHRRIAVAQLIAYLLILAVAMFLFRESQTRDEQLCQTQVDNRQAIRNVVVAIQELGTRLVTDDGTPPTPEQQQAIDQFEQFKKEQLALLEEPVCVSEEE